MKTCNNCNKVKDLTEFHKHSKTKDGLRTYCKICASNMRKERYLNNTERENNNARRWQSNNRKAYNNIIYAWRTRNPQKYQAQIKVMNALASGKLVRQPCIKCGNIRSQGHHPDYNKPLDVIWFCAKHHKEEHSKLRTRKNTLNSTYTFH